MFPGLDPSKLDPKLIAEISELMRTLPHDQLMKMQSIMHNSMAGFDVSNQVREFENALPPGFREKLARIMYAANGVPVAAESVEEPAKGPAISLGGDLDVNEARLTVLRAVRDRTLTPEEALKSLFP